MFELYHDLSGPENDGGKLWGVLFIAKPGVGRVAVLSRGPFVSLADAVAACVQGDADAAAGRLSYPDGSGTAVAQPGHGVSGSTIAGGGTVAPAADPYDPVNAEDLQSLGIG